MVDKLGKTVLVVDDEPDIRLFLKTVLEDAGFDVSVAANGKEALDRMTEKKPDVISLDLVMPRMSGLKFYRYIQKNKERADIPVVVVTAHAHDQFGNEDLEAIRKSRSTGAPMTVVEKPIVPDSYINAVRRIVGLEELASEETSGRAVLEAKLREKMKTADAATLEEALRTLERKGKRKE